MEWGDIAAEPDNGYSLVTKYEIVSDFPNPIPDPYDNAAPDDWTSASAFFPHETTFKTMSLSSTGI